MENETLLQLGTMHDVVESVKGLWKKIIVLNLITKP